MTTKIFIPVLAITLSALHASAQVKLNDVVNTVTHGSTTNSNLGKGLSNDKIIEGLKEALSVGSKNAGASASKLDGFYKNPLIKIPFPKEVKDVEKMARQFGMSKQADKFIQSLNRAAEDAAKKAAPVFLDAITHMTINDGLTILQRGDNAATGYLKNSTTPKLTTEFSPIVKQSLSKTHVTQYWNDVAKVYNKVPFAKKMNPKLEEYVTQKAIEGLFILVGQEEAKIRKDPAAQVTNILQQVFGGR
ncbi:MAG: DUF4197 domain-containing protein [Bacteroidia bacterium]